MYEEIMLDMLDTLILHADSIVELWDWNIYIIEAIEVMQSNIKLLNMFVFSLIVWNIWLTYKTHK